MAKKSITILFAIISLALAISACQALPGFNIFGSGQSADQAKPLSNFVDRRQTIRIGVDEPLGIASYHRGHTKLAALKISINGQQLRSETNNFPETLATSEVLVWGQPAQASLEQVAFPSPACQYLLTAGGPVKTSALPLTPPSSVWTVCHIWTGHVPGTYDLSLAAVDEAQRESQPIVQRIEVIKNDP